MFDILSINSTAVYQISDKFKKKIKFFDLFANFVSLFWYLLYVYGYFKILMLNTTIDLQITKSLVSNVNAFKH